MRTLTYYIAMSLDGYIAAPDGNADDILAEGDHVDWIVSEYPETLPEFVHERFGIQMPGHHFDTVLMGWNTYAVGLPIGVDSPYSHLQQHVFSKQTRSVPSEITLHQGDPVAVVRALKAEPGERGIWLCGGASLAGQLINEIDELALKITPKLFGSGIPLFATEEYHPLPFKRVSAREFETGVTILTMKRAS